MSEQQVDRDPDQSVVGDAFTALAAASSPGDPPAQHGEIVDLVLAQPQITPGEL
ncbi:hypothetical protein [uncultured Pseudonocardia sp.]|uniref:hypothetical protein n=1 Tax=uncultured Pseudonocardia sp. TaxID=211455 RepID=UPI00262B9BD8|nr:hypothetical protein [uncultured Pseudonocardia sp.]